jgi:serine/threonine protein kinase
MSASLIDRNLLFGIVALEMDFVSRQNLVDAMHEWVRDKTRKLGQILQDHQALTDDLRVLLDTLVDQHIQHHDGNIDFNLSSPRWGSSTFAALRQVNDTEIQARLAGESAEVLLEWSHPGQRVNQFERTRYRKLRPHAMGGLGQVFVAEDSGLHREVALKEIRPKHAHDLTSRERFLIEAEITSNLEHPGIVPVYELGTYDDGRLFYTMRFIKGETLSIAIRRFHATSSPESTSMEFRWLLRRFQDVCHTIAYAHSRGVLHRDLKPSNIMMGQFGETLVMDWGLAKLIGRHGVEEESTPIEHLSLPNISGSGTLTATGGVVGTPCYMSPEQADGKLDALGPASDVYGLGATLYVLLTDRRPFGGESDEVIKAIKRGHFPPPKEVKPRVPNALNAICRKAMALKPSQRYESPLALAADIERWLADQPVCAWREPWRDQAQRWMRRHQTLVASFAASVGVALIALGMAVPLLSLAWRSEAAARKNEQHQRFLALQSFDEANQQRALAQNNEKKASEERDRAEGALKFLVEAFRKPDPSADGRALKVVSLLDRAVKRLETSFANQPLMRAALLTAIGDTFSGLGLTQESLAVYQQSYSLRRDNQGQEHPDTLKSMNDLGMAYQDVGQLEKATSLLETTLAGRRAKLGDDHQETIESMNNLAAAYWAAGQFDRAVPLYETALTKQRTNLDDDDPETITMMDNLAVAYGSVGRFDKAIPLHQAILAKFRDRYGEDHPTTLITINNLARAHEAGGNLDEAIRLYEGAFPKLRAKLGEDHPTVLISMNNLARAYQAASEFTKAVSLYEVILAKRRVKLGENNPATLQAGLDLAYVYFAARQPEKAVPLAREFLERIKNGAKPYSPQVQAAISRTAKDLIDYYVHTGQNDLAETYRKLKSLFQKREGEATAEPHLPEKPARREARPPESPPSGTDSKDN